MNALIPNLMPVNRLSGRILLWLVLLCTSMVTATTRASDANSSGSQATIFTNDIFAGALAIRTARDLFDAGRYRDAAEHFEPIHRELNQLIAQGETHRLDMLMLVLDFYAQSLSQQGNQSQVPALMEERHQWVGQLYDDEGYVYASSMGRLAEAYYRADRNELAVAAVKHAINLYENLNPVPEEALRLLQANLIQYKLTSFSTAMLPMDLSEFYSICENSEEFPAHTVGFALAKFVEVGVDYQPVGEWQAYYNSIIEQNRQDPDAEFRIFIPSDTELLRKDICAIEMPAEPVISAATSDK